MNQIMQYLDDYNHQLHNAYSLDPRMFKIIGLLLVILAFAAMVATGGRWGASTLGLATMFVALLLSVARYGLQPLLPSTVFGVGVGAYLLGSLLRGYRDRRRKLLRRNGLGRSYSA